MHSGNAAEPSADRRRPPRAVIGGEPAAARPRLIELRGQRRVRGGYPRVPTTAPLHYSCTSVALLCGATAYPRALLCDYTAYLGEQQCALGAEAADRLAECQRTVLPQPRLSPRSVCPNIMVVVVMTVVVTVVVTVMIMMAPTVATNEGRVDNEASGPPGRRVPPTLPRPAAPASPCGRRGCPRG